MGSPTDTTYTCPFCRQSSPGTGDSCAWCGAPVDVRLRTTSGGWTELPAIADMTRLHAGGSIVQVSGSIAAVADWQLAAGHSVYFPHHALLWQEPAVQLGNLPLKRAWTRLRAGLPLVMAQASGPGRVAFSPESSAQIVAIPVQAGQAVDVAEHRLLVATGAVDYDWYDANVWYSTSGSSGQGSAVSLLKAGLDLAGDEQNDETEWHYPMGQQVDRFTAVGQPGLVMITARGNALVRDLAEGETILVKPPALMFKDPSVQMHLHIEYPTAGVRFWRSWGNRYLWLQLHGPGRVGIESCYESDADPGSDFRQTSWATQQAW